MYVPLLGTDLLSGSLCPLFEIKPTLFLEEPGKRPGGPPPSDPPGMHRNCQQSNGCKQGQLTKTLVKCVITFPQINYLANLYAGDPYVGSREAEIKAKNKRIQELEAENRKLKAQLERYEGR